MSNELTGNSIFDDFILQNESESMNFLMENENSKKRKYSNLQLFAKFREKYTRFHFLKKYTSISENLSSNFLQIHIILLNEIKNEIKLYEKMLEKTRIRKEQISKELCKFTIYKNIYRPRIIVTFQTSWRISELIIKSIKEWHSFPYSKLKKTVPILSFQNNNKPLLLFDPYENKPKSVTRNYFQTQYEKLCKSYKLQPKSIMINELNFPKESKYSIFIIYNFNIQNPLFLLASRIQFFQKSDKIHKHIKNKVNEKSKKSLEIYEKYKKDYEIWKYMQNYAYFSETENNELIKKVDIYGKNTFTAPRFPILPQKRKESIEFDPDLCIFIFKNQIKS